MSRSRVLFFIGLFACSSSGPSSTSIGPSGGTLTSSDGTLTLEIPAGALAADTKITITPTAGPAGTIGQAYDLGPEGTQFAMPIGLRFVLPPNKSPDAVGVGTLVNGQWQRLGIPALSQGTLSVTTTHFSLYAMFDDVLECSPVQPIDAGPVFPDAPSGVVARDNGAGLTDTCDKPSQCYRGFEGIGHCGFPCDSSSACPRGLYCMPVPGTNVRTCQSFDCSNASCPPWSGVECSGPDQCEAICGTPQYPSCPAGEMCFLGHCRFIQCGINTCPQHSTCYFGFCIADCAGHDGCNDSGPVGVDAGVVDAPHIQPDAAL